jgi:tRNA pseudouridine38-40 synthase
LKKPLEYRQTYLARVAFDGAAYVGWQRQPRGYSIQGILEEGFAQVARIPIALRAAGRTDAGVHALDLPCDFAAPFDFDLEKLRRAWNAVIPRNIAVRSVQRAPAGFDARRCASQRTYRYLIDTRNERSPFLARYAWQVPGDLDIIGIQSALNALVGEHDFTSFRASDCEARHAVRRINEVKAHAVTAAELALLAAWHPFPGGPEAGLLALTISGTAFLKHQVRAIVGTLVEVGRGRISPEGFQSILAARDRRLAGRTAPAHGLTLIRVDFPPEALVE